MALRQPENPKSLGCLDLPFFFLFLFLLFRLEDEGLGEKNGKWLKWIGKQALLVTVINYPYLN